MLSLMTIPREWQSHCLGRKTGRRRDICAGERPDEGVWNIYRGDVGSSGMILLTRKIQYDSIVIRKKEGTFPLFPLGKRNKGLFSESILRMQK